MAIDNGGGSSSTSTSSSTATASSSDGNTTVTNTSTDSSSGDSATSTATATAGRRLHQADMTQQMFDNLTQPATAAAAAEPPQQQQQEQYGYQLNPGVFASNYIPLWAGLAEGDQGKGQAVVKSLNESGLVQTSGGWGVGWY